MDTNFIFECSTRYLTSECSEWVRYRVEQEKTKFVSTSGHVIFCLLYKNTNDDVLDNFPKISEHFPKIWGFFKSSPKATRTFPNIFRKLPKISKEEPMFRSYNNKSEGLCKHSNRNLFMLIACYFHVWRYHVYVRKLTWYFTGVYIINACTVYSRVKFSSYKCNSLVGNALVVWL